MNNEPSEEQKKEIDFYNNKRDTSDISANSAIQP